MILHAYNRLPTESFNIEIGGQSFKFATNTAGHVVAELPDDVADVVLTNAPCGYREYGTEAVDPAKPAKTSEAVDPAKLILKSDDGAELDLASLSDAEVHAFAKENDVRVHHNLKGDRLRLAVADGLRAKSQPAA